MSYQTLEQIAKFPSKEAIHWETKWSTLQSDKWTDTRFHVTRTCERAHTHTDALTFHRWWDSIQRMHTHVTNRHAWKCTRIQSLAVATNSKNSYNSIWEPLIQVLHCVLKASIIKVFLYCCISELFRARQRGAEFSAKCYTECRLYVTTPNRCCSVGQNICCLQKKVCVRMASPRSHTLGREQALLDVFWMRQGHRTDWHTDWVTNRRTYISQQDSSWYVCGRSPLTSLAPAVGGGGVVLVVGVHSDPV